MSAPFNEAQYWPAFKRAGMLSHAIVVYTGESRARLVDVEFHRPTTDPVSGMESMGYWFQYQNHDLPDLREGAQVKIAHQVFRVRESPRVYGVSATGYFMFATLTLQVTKL